MPAGLIEEDDGMGLRFDDLGDFRQVESHGLCVAAGQDEASALALLGADGAEDVGRLGALIMARAGAGAALRPAPRDLVLLPDPRFVLPPKLYIGARREPGADRFQHGGEIF